MTAADWVKILEADESPLARLAWADWLEESGRELAGECVRWMLATGRRPENVGGFLLLYGVPWRWTPQQVPYPTHVRLPDALLAAMPENNPHDMGKGWHCRYFPTAVAAEVALAVAGEVLGRCGGAR